MGGLLSLLAIIALVVYTVRRFVEKKKDDDFVPGTERYEEDDPSDSIYH